MLSGVQTLRTSGAPANMRAGRLAVDPATGSVWVGRGVATAPLLLVSESLRDDRYLRLSGGALTGHVTRTADPTDPGHLARKAYVDAQRDAAVASAASAATVVYLPLAGGALTGHVTRTADPTDPSHLARKAYVDAQRDTRLALTGGTLTGPVVYAADPTDPNHLARKSYVDTAVAAVGGPYLSASGGTVTGPISIAANPTDPSHLARKAYVDSAALAAATAATDALAANVAAAFVPLSGATLTGHISYAVNPTTDSHLTRKGYVDAQVSSAVSGLLSTASGDARYLRLIGGSLTGALLVPYGGTTSSTELQLGAANNGIYMTSSGQPIHFVIAGAVAGRLDSGGGLGASTSLVNRAAGDGRYALRNIGVVAGAGLTGGGNFQESRTISHADTSTQASVNNSGSTVIQDVTLDNYGHVTDLVSVDLSSVFAPIGDSWPGVYTGSSASNDTFPVGHVLACAALSPTSLARNASGNVRLDTGSTQAYVNNGAGALLTGLYRSSGYCGEGGGVSYYAMRRVS